MTQDRATPNTGETRAPHQKAIASSYYALLDVHPSASAREIRQAYRELSKLYHPDTTSLPAALATAKFQQLNEAYATLSSPERRLAYDRTIGYSRVPVVQRSTRFEQSTATSSRSSSSAYLDPTDRPLSPGEVFALFILGLTFVGCLVLAIAIGFTRGDQVWHPVAAQTPIPTHTTVAPEAVNPASAGIDAVTAVVAPALVPATPLTPSTGVDATTSTVDLDFASEQLNDTPAR